MQYLVKVGYNQNRERKIKWLQSKGYTGSLPKDYPYGVIFVEGGHFFGGNVTCFAASVACGKKPLSWEEWKRRISE